MNKDAKEWIMVLVILLMGVTLFLAAKQRDDLKDVFLKTFGLWEAAK